MEFDLGDFTTNLARALSSFRLTEDTTFTVVEDKPVEACDRKRWRYIDCAHASGTDRLEVSTINGSPMVHISIDITEAKPGQRTWGTTSACRIKSANFSPTRPLRALANSVINRVIVENSLALFARRDYVASLDKDAKEFEFKLAELKDALPELHITHYRQPMGTSCGVYLSEIQGSLRVSDGRASVYVERVGTVTFTKFIAMARILAEPDDALIDAILTVCSNPEGAKRLLEFLQPEATP